MKKAILHQYQQLVDKAASQVTEVTVPPEGWLKTLRKSLGMSGAQLARLLGVTRAQIAQSERNELSGAITLRTMHTMAAAMGCRVVYAIVPAGKVEDLLVKRVNDKARQVMDKVNTHMALEAQALNEERRAYELTRLEQELLRDMPSDLWDDVK